MRPRAKMIARVLICAVVLHFFMWSWSIRRAVIPVLPELIPSVLAIWEAEAEKAGREPLSASQWTLLVCAEDMQILDPKALERIQTVLPATWNVGGEWFPPAPAKLSELECSQCTVVCTNAVFASPFVSVVDTSWWQGPKAGTEYRHVGVHVGAWYFPVRTRLLGMS